MELEKTLIFAHALADAAGAVTRAAFRSGLTAERKGDESPVTAADRATEAAMRALIREHFPGHGIFGEEGARENEASPWQWVLDPIDGTRAFVAGYPLFTTLIALCHEGTPVLGVVDQPVLKERWCGIAGGPSLLNGAKVRVRPAALEDSVIASTSADYFNASQRAAYARLQARVGMYVNGGDGYAYAMLATGQLHAVVDAGLKPYDFCAHVPIIQGAGGGITDWQGRALTIDSGGDVVAASSAEAHAGILAVLAAEQQL